MKIVNMEVLGCQLFVCFVELMFLEFEKLYINFFWGWNLIIVEKMELIGKLFVKYGFKFLMF